MELAALTVAQGTCFTAPQGADSFAASLEGHGKWNSDRSADKQIQPAALPLGQSSWHRLWTLKSALKASRVTAQRKVPMLWMSKVLEW